MYLFLNDECHQGRAKWRNCRLSTETPDYQLGWAVLAASRLMDTLKRNFHSPNLTCFITLEVHIINDLSAILLLGSCKGI